MRSLTAARYGLHSGRSTRQLSSCGHWWWGRTSAVRARAVVAAAGGRPIHAGSPTPEVRRARGRRRPLLTDRYSPYVTRWTILATITYRPFLTDRDLPTVPYRPLLTDRCCTPASGIAGRGIAGRGRRRRGPARSPQGMPCRRLPRPPRLRVGVTAALAAAAPAQCDNST